MFCLFFLATVIQITNLLVVYEARRLSVVGFLNNKTIFTREKQV